MRACAVGRLYDTATADTVAVRSGDDPERVALCRTPLGHWFLHSTWPDGTEGIAALTTLSALQWCEHAGVDYGTRLHHFGVGRSAYFMSPYVW